MFFLIGLKINEKKTTILKIALIVLSVILVGMAVANMYISVMFFKLADASLFDMLDVVAQYDLFEKLYMGGYSTVLTSFLLLLMFGLLIKVFLVKPQKEKSGPGLSM